MIYGKLVDGFFDYDCGEGFSICIYQLDDLDTGSFLRTPDGNYVYNDWNCNGKYEFKYKDKEFKVQIS